MRTWFITGGTPGGFGMAYANAALDAGDRVALTARRPHELAEWARRQGDRVLVLPLDVTDEKQIRQAVEEAETRFGGIDVLVNNAGRGWYGSVEGTADEVVRRTFDLNFFGTVAVIRAVLPGMRARGSGWIVNMSSVAGLVGVTGFGYYSAAKFALEGLGESLRSEVEPLGIKVLTVEPGAFRTNAYAGFEDEPIGEAIPDYQPMLAAIRAAFVEDNGKQPGDPDRGARAVLAAMSTDNPPQRLVLGNAGYDAVAGKLDSMLTELRAHESLSRGADFRR
ncbi:oxidoreductase [Kutzneria kofuensis]|uniref:NAD(P)-dependent dehydrogenase (Short-subunit alcohol dehydrogenase family) n=1 Tax=Kutzneria kofuensis TaxID=103725 RepID=A0A7W9NM34_9PSEU|nr:oxidoreductase [Kutzneria kofuensis]MBB5897414.1 NAD(P)-dependent dehydrogenase (short-subunit alcohol dehydrogenase family) [Kutzneria kofuensis]